MNNSSGLRLRKVAEANFPTQFGIFRIHGFEGSHDGLDEEAVVLGMGRAIGETMAVQMVIGNASQATASLLQPGSTLTTRIVQDMGEASGVFRSALFAQALMLLLLSVFLIISIRLISRERKHA